jgi:acetolactate synthase-1/2/3 large subunit
VICLAGDGAFLMTGLELLTARQLSLPVIVLVLRDRELAQIAQFQQIALGVKTCSDLPDYDLASICGGSVYSTSHYVVTPMRRRFSDRRLH